MTPTNDTGVVAAAGHFLLHCRDYSALADAHVAFNRGLFDIEVDEARRWVRFVPRPVEGAAPEPASLLEDLPHDQDVVAAAFAARDQSERAVALIHEIPHRIEGGRFVLDGFDRLAAPELTGLTNRLMAPHDIPLDAADDLGEFTAEEFRRFWGALARWSVAAMGLHLDDAFAGRPPTDRLPTQFVERAEFVGRVAALSGLPPATVNLCLSRLTYGSGGVKNPDPYLQPLLCTPTHVAWSPHLIQATKAERNMLKLMARLSDTKALADNLIGGRERVVAKRFGDFLSGHGYQYKTRVPLPDRRGEIDLLAFRSAVPEEVLVVEVKGVLGVDEVNEVDHATAEMVFGQGQLQKVIDFLKPLTVGGRQSLWRQPPWAQVTSFYGVVLTPNAHPHTGYSHTVFPAVTDRTVRGHFYPSDFKSPRKFWQTAVDKRWLRPAAAASRAYRTVRVGSLTYELPGGVSAANPVPQARRGTPPGRPTRPRRG